MAGQIKQLIDTIVEKRSNGLEALANMTRVKMIMKGIFPERYTSTSEDDPVVIEKLKNLAKDLNINI